MRQGGSRVPDYMTGPWPKERIEALGNTCTVPVAARILNISRTVAYNLVKNDEFPVPVRTIGSSYRVLVPAMIDFLFHDTNPTATTPTPQA
ncbi:helix-turn-helix domain-containing protein [Haloglycomyces albus]|uniref:helix-turn-helix domain-containing protein n=1 Tax=Haloglycomyces albus TaxID=526067 RepID=UPI00046D066F|nr:helix-turn-helix domain-containing protein [Haloglycomyces albus]